MSRMCAGMYADADLHMQDIQDSDRNASGTFFMELIGVFQILLMSNLLIAMFAKTFDR